MTRFPAFDVAAARELIGRMAGLEGAVLPMLHALQDTYGYVDKAALPIIADAVNVSRAEVYGTLTFYHDFREAPVDGRVIKLCRAEACQAVGCEQVVAEVERRLGVHLDHRATIGAATVETAYCLGNCALGPAALVDGELVARLDADRLVALCQGGAPELSPSREQVPA